MLSDIADLPGVLYAFVQPRARIRQRCYITRQARQHMAYNRHPDELMVMCNHLSHVQDALQMSLQNEANVRINNENTLLDEIQQLKYEIKSLTEYTQRSTEASAQRITVLEYQRDDLLARQPTPFAEPARFSPAMAINPYLVTRDTHR